MVDPAGLVVLVAAIQLGQRHAQRLGDEQEGQEDAGGVQSRAPPAKRSRHGDGSMIRNTSISQQISQSRTGRTRVTVWWLILHLSAGNKRGCRTWWTTAVRLA